MTEPARGGPPVRVGLERLPGGQGLPLPRASTAGSVGYDLCAAVTSDRVLAPGERALLPTGFAVAIPDGYEGQIRPRSGLALRHGIVLPNAPGTIDSDYRGELGVIVWNSASDPFTIRRGDRIAQLVIAPVVRVVWEERSHLDRTGRGAGGFGHSGLGSGEGAG